MIRTALMFSILISLSGCAAIQQDYENRMCNYDAAYEEGANAARQKGQMQGSMIASNCPVQARDAVMSGYRAGYASVPQQRPTAQPAPGPVVIVNPGAGFQNPTYPSRGGGTVIINPTAPSQPQQQCLESYGRRVCGYGCKESYGNIRCASNPRHSCLASYGKIYCGLNCREDVGRVVCDEWD